MENWGKGGPNPTTIQAISLGVKIDPEMPRTMGRSRKHSGQQEFFQGLDLTCLVLAR